MDDRFAFAVLNAGKQKAFVWVWMERVTPKKARVPRPDVVGVRVANDVYLEGLITNAWRCQAPRPLVKRFDEQVGRHPGPD